MSNWKHMGTLVKAALAAPAALSWLNSSAEATVTGVFKSSCILARDDGHLISLVLPELGAGPFSLVLEDSSFTENPLKERFLGMQVASPVKMCHGILYVQGLEIDTNTASIWDPKPAWSSLKPERIRDSQPLLRNLALLHGSPGSLCDILSGAKLNQVQTTIWHNWLGLTGGLKVLEIRNDRDNLNEIVGVGVGLTPSGDDFILGIILAIWAILPAGQAENVAAEILNAVRGRTNRYSEAWLTAASKGEASEPWHELFLAIASGKPSELQRAVINIAAVGSTSGSDALAGYILTSELLLESSGRRE